MLWPWGQKTRQGGELAHLPPVVQRGRLPGTARPSVVTPCPLLRPAVRTVALHIRLKHRPARLRIVPILQRKHRRSQVLIHILEVARPNLGNPGRLFHRMVSLGVVSRFHLADGLPRHVHPIDLPALRQSAPAQPHIHPHCPSNLLPLHNHLSLHRFRKRYFYIEVLDVSVEAQEACTRPSK